MAKHDQKILKYLNQNLDSSPTIIDFMTKLGINISDVSDSLSSLLAQGVISKRMNSDGMECWFLASAPASPFPSNAPPISPSIPSIPPQSIQPVKPYFGNPPGTQPSISIPSPITPTTLSPQTTSAPPSTPNYGVIPLATTAANYGVTPMQPSRDLGGMGSMGVKTDSFKPVQEIPQPTTATASQPESLPEQPASVTQSEPKESVQAGLGGLSNQEQPYQPMPVFQTQSPKGVGFITFILGLLIAVAASVWLGTRLTTKEIARSAATFVDQKAFTDAGIAAKEFEAKTKSHISALEAQTKTMSAQLDSILAITDSLRMAEEARQKLEAKSSKNSKPSASKSRRTRSR